VVLHKLSGACRDRLKKVQSTKEELEFKKKQVVRDRAAQDRKVSHCNTLQHTATHSNTQQHTATHSNTLQHNAAFCNTLQHPATPCNTLQRTATLGRSKQKSRTVLSQTRP